MISKKTTLPPQISQHYNSLLLSQPAPKFRETTETFEKMWEKVLKRWKKLDKCPAKKEKCEQLKLEILELYERAKAKEKEREGQTDHKTNGFMYSVHLPKGMANGVCQRLRFGREIRIFPFSGSHRAFYKARHKLKCRAALHD